MHCSLKSIPTLSNFHSLAPQGCFFFILIISPTLNSIFPLLSLFSINLPVKLTIAENIFYVKVFFFFLFSLFLSYSIFFYLTYFIPFFISSAIWATLACSSIISFTVSARAYLKNAFCFLLLYFLYIFILFQISFSSSKNKESTATDYDKYSQCAYNTY